MTLFGLFAIFVSSANADQTNDSVIPQSFTSKCDSLKRESAQQKRSDKIAYIIWDANSEQLLGCANSKDKEDKLNEKLELISQNRTALTEFLSFRERPILEDKVSNQKKSENSAVFGSLILLNSGEFKSFDVFDGNNKVAKIIKIPEAAAKTKTSSKEYFFIRLSDYKLKNKCDLTAFSDRRNLKLDPTGTQSSKNCIFETFLFHFELVQVTEIEHPEFSIERAETDEGGTLNFKITKKGEQSLAASFNYEILSEAGTKTNSYSCDKSNIVRVLPTDKSKNIKICTEVDKGSGLDQQISVRIFNPLNSHIKNDVAMGLIKNISPKATLSASIETNEVDAGDVLKFQVKRKPGGGDLPFSINYKLVGTSNNNLAAGHDIEYKSGSIAFSSRDVSKIIRLKTKVVDLKGTREKVTLRLSSKDDVKFIEKDATGWFKKVETETKRCWDNSIVNLAETCPERPDKICPDGSRVENENLCEPCDLKPTISSIRYPRKSQRNVIISGKACPHSEAILAANDRVDTTKSAIADKNGNFKIIIDKAVFFPEDEILSLQIISAIRNTQRSSPNATDARYIVGDELTSFFKPDEDCPIPEPKAEEDSSLPLLKGLRVKPVRISKKGNTCVIEVEVINNTNKDAILTISYNPKNEVHVPSQSTVTEDISITDRNIDRDILDIQVGLETEDGAERGNIDTAKDSTNDKIRKALKIFLSEGQFVGGGEDADYINVESANDGAGRGEFKFVPAAIAKDRIGPDELKNCMDVKDPTFRCAQSFLDEQFAQVKVNEDSLPSPSIAQLNVDFRKIETEKKGKRVEISDFKFVDIEDETSRINAKFNHYYRRDYEFDLEVKKSASGDYFAVGKLDYTYQPLSGSALQSNLEDAILVKDIPLKVDVKSGDKGFLDYIIYIIGLALVAIFGDIAVGIYRGTRGQVWHSFLMLNPDFRTRVFKRREINLALKQRFGRISDMEVLADGLWQDDAPSGENWSRKKYRYEICKYAFESNKLNELIIAINAMRPNFDSIEEL